LVKNQAVESSDRLMVIHAVESSARLKSPNREFSWVKSHPKEDLKSTSREFSFKSPEFRLAKIYPVEWSDRSKVTCRELIKLPVRGSHSKSYLVKSSASQGYK